MGAKEENTGRQGQDTGRLAIEHQDFYKSHSSKQEMMAVVAVALQDHIIHSHQLQDFSLAHPFKSRIRNTKKVYKPKDKETVTAVSDTGLRKQDSHHKPKEDAEKENVLDPSPPVLTLAQKLELAEPASLPPAAEEWVQVKQRCAIVHRQVGWIWQKNILPIPGYPESLKLDKREQKTALIKKACLKALEKLTGKKFCLVCKNKQPQWRITHDGACLFKTKHTAQ
ncbi:LOW QUALITY PROTEIN: RING finger protein 32 [Melanerpes formicivorus]|uniref:LOW QUALITY PROTEIN: RING finger protein 32 n=1 Tax=Melanerpes formicivorus TaxID=211600 RepID=UPI00358FFC0B